jgi:glucokinase
MPTGTPKRPRYLIADVGGTHARFALCSSVQTIEQISIVATADYPTIEQAIRAYLQRCGNPPVKRAVMGIANPLLGDHMKMTNSRWEFSIEKTRQALGFEHLRLINDFTALALSLPHLSAAELDQVGAGTSVPNSPLGLLGPGTGLGVSALIPGRNGWTPLAGEGGHANFAPSSELELQLWQQARQAYGHVSIERLASGSGLQFIYQALCRLAAAPSQDYSPADISRQALAGACVQCRRALDTFCAILGTAASDLALTLGARGGIYIGGGIVPQLGSYFAQSPFRTRFEDKGRFSGYLAAIPVFVITSANPGLLGAAAYVEAFPNEQ